MSAEIQQDPYTLVAHHLQEGEATRAELKALTWLDYAPIQAALERFELMDTVNVRTDGMGVEHYSWKGEAYAPDPPREGGTKEVEQITATSLGIRVVEEIKRVIRELPDGAQVDSPHIYNSLLARFPSIATITMQTPFRGYIGQVLRELDEGSENLLTLIEVGTRGRAHTYRKNGKPTQVSCVDCGKPRPNNSDRPRCADCYKAQLKEPDKAEPEDSINPDRVEALVAAGLTTTEMCAELGISTATWTRHRKADPKLEAAHANGLKRRQEIEKLSAKEEHAASLEKVSAKNPGRNGHGELTPPKSEKVITSPITAVADISNINEEAKTGNGSLVEFLDGLKTERDELNVLIRLLEKRIGPAPR